MVWGGAGREDFVGRTNKKEGGYIYCVMAIKSQRTKRMGHLFPRDGIRYMTKLFFFKRLLLLAKIRDGFMVEETIVVEHSEGGAGGA